MKKRKCEKCGTENKKNAIFCMKCGNPMGTSPQKKKNKLVLIPLCVLGGILMTVIMAILIPTLIGMAVSVGSEEEAEQLVFYEGGDGNLILRAGQSSFHTGEACTVNLIAQIPETEEEAKEYHIQEGGEDITSFDETQLEDTGEYKVFRYSFSTTEKEPVTHQYVLTDGEKESQPLSISFTGSLTVADIQKCSDIGKDLESYIEEKKLEEADADTCLEEVLKWLETDDRVLEAQRNSDTVIYISTEHVAGIYTLPPEEGYLGSTSASTDFVRSAKTANGLKQYLSDQTLPPDKEGGLFYIDGKQTITNTRWYLSGSNAENGNDRSIAESFRVHQKFFSNLGSIAEFAEISGGLAENGDEFLADLLNKDLVHFGVITQICHGSFIRKNDGSFISLYNVYDFVRDNKTMEQAVSDLELQNEQEFLDNFYTEHIEDVAENTGIFVNATSFWISSNLYKHVYQNCFFDNTIIYFGSCFGILDQSLVDFFLERGVRMIMGYETPCHANAESVRFVNAFNKLFGTNTHGGESGGEDGLDDFLSHQADFMGYVLSYGNKGIRWLEKLGGGNAEDSYYVAYSAEHPSWYPEWAKPVMNWIYDRGDDIQGGFRTFHLKQFSNYEKVRALSYGTLSGKVVTRRTQIFYDTEGNETVNTLEATPARQANLTFYQLLDQQFDRREGQERTGDDGTFTVENLRWGVYGIRVTGNGIVDFETGVTFCDDQFDGGTIEVNPYNASYTGFLMTKGEETDQPVTNATVRFTLKDYELEKDASLVGQTYTATTDGNGYFTIANLPGGDYSIEFADTEGNTMKRSESLTNGYDYNYTVIYMNAEREKVELMDYQGRDAVKGLESLGYAYEDRFVLMEVWREGIGVHPEAYSDTEIDGGPMGSIIFWGNREQEATDGWMITEEIELISNTDDVLSFVDYSLCGLTIGMDPEEAEQILLDNGWNKFSENQIVDWELYYPEKNERELWEMRYYGKEDRMIAIRISNEFEKLCKIGYGEDVFVISKNYKYNR